MFSIGGLVTLGWNEYMDMEFEAIVLKYTSIYG